MTERAKVFDLHLHSKYSRPPEFTPYSPDELVAQAAKVGLDGLAITGHNTLQGLKEVLSQEQKMIVVPGLEITSFEGIFPFHMPHILALGVAPDSRGIPVFKRPEDVVRWIHDHGGVAIAAHPKQEGGLTSLSYNEVRQLSNILDGVETTTLRGVNNDLVRLADDFGMAHFGSSDAHLLEQVGLVGTEILGNVQTWRDVITAIRNKKTNPVIRFDIPPEIAIRRSRNRVVEAILNIGKRW